MFSCMYVPHFLYPIVCRRTLGLPCIWTIVRSKSVRVEMETQHPCLPWGGEVDQTDGPLCEWARCADMPAEHPSSSADVNTWSVKALFYIWRNTPHPLCCQSLDVKVNRRRVLDVGWAMASSGSGFPLGPASESVSLLVAARFRMLPWCDYHQHGHFIVPPRRIPQSPACVTLTKSL